MSSSSNKKVKRVCPTCKTTKFRQTSDSGLVCKYGHKMLGIQAEQAEDDGFAGGRGTRRRVIPKITDTMQASNPIQQKSDFLIVIQYTLQVISRCMVQELNFPPELETTIRELWLLYLSDSKKEIAEAYMFEAYEKEAIDKIKGSDSQMKREIYEKLEQEEMGLDEFNSSDESSSEEDEGEDGFRQRKSSSNKIQQVGTSRIKWLPLRYSNVLVFIYLACIYLNYPILPNDLVRWSRTGQIPFLNMQERIPEQLLGSLSMFLSNSMTHTPSTDQVAREAYQLARCFSTNCKLEFPEYNIPLYLDRFCAQFFLPVEGYYYANYIFSTYRQDRYLNLSIVHRSYQSIPATTFLMSCVLSAVKFIYGVGDHLFDTMSCVSEFDTSMTKEKWVDLIQQNIARWKKVNEEQDDLDNIIQMIRDTSVATKLSAHTKDKQNVIMNTLNQTLGRNTTRLNRDQSKQVGMLMDTYDMMRNTTHEDSMELDSDNTPPTIQQGDFYYGRKTGLAPQDYLDVVELASLVTGQTTNSYIEIALQKIDNHVINSNPSRTIRKAKYERRYSHTTVMPTTKSIESNTF